MTYSSGTESDASTDGNVQVVLSKHCSQIADLERRLTYELGKRLELTSLVDTTKSEVAQLKKSLDAEVKARCEGLEATHNLTRQAIDTCDSIGAHKAEPNLNLSMDAFQEIIHKEKMDRERADEDILMTVSRQLKEDKPARQKSDYIQLDELNAVIEEHIKNFFAGKSNDDLDQRRGNMVTADHSVHECVVAGTLGWSKPVTVLLTLLAVSFLKWTATAWVSTS